MNKSGKRLVVVAMLVVIFIAVNIVNLFIYPFKSAKPNFADVERVFNKIDFPSDWVEISSSENRGIAGRACPIEGSGCFSIGKRFNVPSSITTDSIQSVYSTSGCSVVSAKEHEVIEGDSYISFECSIEGLTVSGDLQKIPGILWEISLYVAT